MRILVHGPGIRQWTVDTFKVFPPPFKPADHVSSRHIVPTLANSGGDSAQRQLGRPKPKVHDFDAVSRLLPSLQPFRLRHPTESRLEPEIGAGFGQPIDLLQNQAACGNRGEIGLKRRQAHGDQVRVDEVNDPRLIREKLARESRLACAVGTGDDDATRMSFTSGHTRRRSPTRATNRWGGKKNSSRAGSRVSAAQYGGNVP